LTSKGDNDANDDGDDLSKDDANNEDEEESSDKVERLLAIPTPPLSLVSLTSYTLPPLLMPFPVYTPLPTSSFPLPSSIPSSSGSESIPEADIPLQKRARFTTTTSRYEIGESSVATAARQIRSTLTIAESRRADGKLIGRLRRERRYFRTVATHYAQEVAHSRDYCAWIMDYCQSREVHTSTLLTQMEALQREHVMQPGMATIAIPQGHVLEGMYKLPQPALMCSRMFPEEVDKIKKYIGGLPDMILGSVKASRSKTMQEVIEFTTELMEDKTKAYAECQADNKRKSEDIARNNQNQQPYKRQNTGMATIAIPQEQALEGLFKLLVNALTPNS
nr:hypothetical protein [Tanacetum cinerariifolium]